MKIVITLVPKFWKYVNKNGPYNKKLQSHCWSWLGKSLTKAGYGQCIHNGRRWYAHILSYLNAYGSIRQGRELHHQCFNANCINPSHIQELTHTQHSIIHKGKI